MKKALLILTIAMMFITTLLTIACGGDNTDPSSTVSQRKRPVLNVKAGVA